MEMSVYVLFHCIAYEGDTFLGAYKYLSQAQEAEYAWKLENFRKEIDSEWTEIREVLLGAAPSFEAGKVVED